MSGHDDSVNRAAVTSAERPPLVAGQHYPRDPTQLAEMVDSLLDAVEPVDGAPSILWSPYGDYGLSGTVMAQAYRQAQCGDYNVVVVIGPNQLDPDASDLAVWSGGPWRTPLGPVGIDRGVAKGLIESSVCFVADAEPHLANNAIECQLPFIQRASPDTPIVPILVGNPSNDNLSKSVADLAEILTRRKALLIVASNLCQKPAYDDARRVDSATMYAIETLDSDEVVQSIDYALNQSIPGLTRCVCHERLLLLALRLTRSLGADDVKVLGYANSGDAPACKSDQVIGYAAVMFWHWEPIVLTSGDEECLLRLVQDSIRARLAGADLPTMPSNSPAMQRRSGVFVTLRQDGELRGCTGDVSGKRKLGAAVQHSAITAAFSDPRFPPLTPRELLGISVEISVLSPWRRILDPREIEVGVHGLVLRSGRHTGLLLPQVATDRDWNREEFLEAVCRKAGARANAWQRGALLYTFTAQVFGDPAN